VQVYDLNAWCLLCLCDGLVALSAYVCYLVVLDDHAAQDGLRLRAPVASDDEAIGEDSFHIVWDDSDNDIR
jgi:hypothetical protein